MDKILQKLAKQLNSYDEASLASLWEKYYIAVKDFQPTKAWEESVLILGFIQTLRWKNQLFNHNWSQQAATPGQEPPPLARDLGETPVTPGGTGPLGRRASGKNGKSGKVLAFRPPKKD